MMVISYISSEIQRKFAELSERHDAITVLIIYKA